MAYWIIPDGCGQCDREMEETKPHKCTPDLVLGAMHSDRKKEEREGGWGCALQGRAAVRGREKGGGGGGGGGYRAVMKLDRSKIWESLKRERGHAYTRSKLSCRSDYICERERITNVHIQCEK